MSDIVSTRYFAASFVARLSDGRLHVGLTFFNLESAAPLPVSPELWETLLNETRKEHPNAVLVGVTPLSSDPSPKIDAFKFPE